MGRSCTTLATDTPHLQDVSSFIRSRVLLFCFGEQYHLMTGPSACALRISYRMQSYTPKKLSIRAGSSFHDLVEVMVSEALPFGQCILAMLQLSSCPRLGWSPAGGQRTPIGRSDRFVAVLQQGRPLQAWLDRRLYIRNDYDRDV